MSLALQSLPFLWQGLLVTLHVSALVVLLSIGIARERRHAQRELEESRERMRHLADGLLLAREEERAAIAREVHDVLGQAVRP